MGGGGGEAGGIYYSTPAEIVERKQQRVLTKDGVFVSRDMKSPPGSMDSDWDHGVRPKLGEGEFGCYACFGTPELSQVQLKIQGNY